MKRSTIIVIKRALAEAMVACATLTEFAPSAWPNLTHRSGVQVGSIAVHGEKAGSSSTEANYVEHYPVDSKTKYYGDVVCKTTGPNLAMAEPTAQSDMRIDDQVRSLVDSHS